MQRVRFILLLLGLCWFFGQNSFLFAQEEDEEDDDDEPGYNNEDILDTDWDGYMPDLYSRGDQTVIIALGVNFPTVFFNNGKTMDHHFTPPVGGSLGPLAYTFFLTSHFFLGGEISFKFNSTLGQNTIYIIPFGVRTGWQFLVRRFEFPISLVIGLAPQRYLNKDYAGLFIKGGASAFYRFNPDWSFGLNADWHWYPQWPQENGRPVPEKNMDANTLDLTLAARYHF